MATIKTELTTNLFIVEHEGTGKAGRHLHGLDLTEALADV
jgi:hypothetical protein